MEVICYYCNEQTDDWRRNFTELKSQHSNTPIVDFLNRFLDDFKSQRNIDDISNCICTKCLDRIDDYDWMCVLCSEKENQLKELLLATEKLHTSKEPVLIQEEEPKLDLAEPSPKKIKIESNFKMTGSESIHRPQQATGPIENKLGVMKKVRIELVPIEQMFREKEEPQHMDSSDEEFTMPLRENTGDQSSDSDFLPNSISKRLPQNNAQRNIGKPTSKKRTVQPEQNNIKIAVNNKHGEIIQEKSFNINKKLDQRVPAKHNGSVSSQYSQPLPNCPQSNSCAKIVTDISILSKAQLQNRYCTPCKMHFKTTKDYNRHMDKHQRMCELCNIILPSIEKCVVHMQWHQTPMSLMCRVCKFKSPNESENRLHSELHKGKPDFQCVICDKMFSRKRLLRIHVQWHGEPEFLCDNCGKKFNSVSSMREHRKLHFDEKKFECAYCSKAFKVKSYLRVHMRIHASTERPFACSFCDMCFKRKDHWQVHEKRHRENTKTEKCTICSAAFEHKFHLKQHMENRHRTVNPQGTI